MTVTPPQTPFLDDRSGQRISAFETRLVAEVPRLRRHAARRHGPGRASDLVQEALLLALQNQAKFESSAPLWPWLQAIADRHAARLSERAQLGPGVFGDLDELAHPDAASSGRAEAAEAVTRLLARLAPDDEAVLRRHHLGGESVAELALSLGAPQGTIKARLWRARRRLIAIAGVASLGALAAVLWVRSPRAPSLHPTPGPSLGPSFGPSFGPRKPAGLPLAVGERRVFAAAIIAETIKVPPPPRRPRVPSGPTGKLSWRVLPPDTQVQVPSAR